MSEQEEKMITLVDADGNETLYEYLVDPSRFRT